MHRLPTSTSARVWSRSISVVAAEVGVRPSATRALGLASAAARRRPTGTPTAASAPLARHAHQTTHTTHTHSNGISSAYSTSSSSSSSTSSSSSSFRWLLWVGCSSLLAAQLVAATAEDACLADATVWPERFASAPSVTLYDPPPPPIEWQENWDGLASVPAPIDPETGRKILVTHHLLFIRHGQYVLPNRHTLHVDPVLTEKGREQARLTGKRIASLGYPISTIHCSTMARAKETAELIAESFPGVPLEPTDLLREGVPCAHYPPHPTWHPSAKDKATDPLRIKLGFEHVVKRWREVDGVQVHTVEEWEEAMNKKKEEKGAEPKEESVIPPADDPPAIVAGGDVHSSGKGTISLTGDQSSSDDLPPLRVDRYSLVVCHGNVIRYSALRALQLPVQAWLRLAIYNTGITHLTVRSDGHVGLQTLGDTGHLPKELITYH